MPSKIQNLKSKIIPSALLDLGSWILDPTKDPVEC